MILSVISKVQNASNTQEAKKIVVERPLAKSIQESS